MEEQTSEQEKSNESLREHEQQLVQDMQEIREAQFEKSVDVQAPSQKVPFSELTDEQLQTIRDIEANAGIEFYDYDEAVEWERNEYGDNDMSQDDPFDLER